MSSGGTAAAGTSDYEKFPAGPRLKRRAILAGTYGTPAPEDPRDSEHKAAVQAAIAQGTLSPRAAEALDHLTAVYLALALELAPNHPGTPHELERLWSVRRFILGLDSTS